MWWSHRLTPYVVVTPAASVGGGYPPTPYAVVTGRLPTGSSPADPVRQLRHPRRGGAAAGDAPPRVGCQPHRCRRPVSAGPDAVRRLCRSPERRRSRRLAPVPTTLPVGQRSGHPYKYSDEGPSITGYQSVDHHYRPRSPDRPHMSKRNLPRAYNPPPGSRVLPIVTRWGVGPWTVGSGYGTVRRTR